MKKYTKVLAVIMLSLVFVNIDAADNIRPNQISFNAGGNTTVGLPEGTGMMSRANFIKEFVTGHAKNIQISAEWIKDYTTVQRDAAADALVSDINIARDTYQDGGLGALRLLQEADQMAAQLLNLAEAIAKEKIKEESKEEPKEEPAVDLSAKNKAIIDEFKQSTKDNYIENLQTLIINNNFKSGDEVFKEAEDFGIDLLKSHIKDDTKWTGMTGNTLALGNNAHGMTLSQLKELIAATMIVFDDPSCQFESTGAYTNNKAKKMHLSEFLVQHVSVDQAKVLSINNQASSMPKVTNLEQLAASVNN